MYEITQSSRAKYEKWASKLTKRATSEDVTQYLFDINYCCNEIFNFKVEINRTNSIEST